MSENDEKQRLIEQMRSNKRDFVLEAISILRQNGWLSDGSLRNADLRGADLSGIDLQGADLRVVNLQNANLQGVDLRQADLAVANLKQVNLNAAHLEGADLNGVDLSQAVLSEAILAGVNLRRAYLVQTDLRRAFLGRAFFSDTFMFSVDFTDAICLGTVFVSVDLSHSFGLAEVQHSAPSSIGVDTLVLSRGEIPDIFLRGCGLPDTVIVFARSLVEKPIDYFSCFISYSHADKTFARRIHDTLQGCDIRCYFDEHQMVPGDPIHEAIDRGIRIWDKVILCCSEASLNSWWVEREFNKVLLKEEELRKRYGRTIPVLIPLDLDGYIFSDKCDSWIAREVKTRLAADFKGWEHDNALFEREIERVFRALRTDEGREPTPNPKL
ncbi:MAG: toll/interleukin-1 receptor domain-containing protein [Anaerolineae bacterium]|nr:toll/interleukin-1 receptor domain-containing protein [Anaerolineae bacterium]